MIDITIPHMGGFYWWDDAPARVEEEVHGVFRVGYITMSLHSGTHVDLPWHVGLHRDVQIKRCYTVRVVSMDRLHDKDIDGRNVDGVIVKTGQGSALRNRSIGRDYVALSYDDASVLLSWDIKIVGIDAPSIEIYDGNGDIHRLFLSRGIPILETADLTDAEEGIYKLYLYTLRVNNTILVDALPTVALLETVKGGM